jgi:hypothetical protein
VVYLEKIVYWLHFLPIALGGFLLVTKKLPIAYLSIIMLMIASTAADFLGVYFAHHWHNNMIVSHIYSMLDVSLILLFVRSFCQNLKTRRIINGVVVVYLLFSFIQLYVVGYLSFNYVQAILGTILILLSILYFYFEVFFYEYVKDLAVFAPFWILSMMFLYYSGTFCWNLIFPEVLNGNLFIEVNYVNDILLIVTNLVITFCLWMAGTRTSN